MDKKLFYQMYPIPFTYPVWDNDPLKPLKSYGLWEMQDELPKLQELGVDVIWLSACLNSPRLDHGYDVSDYMRIDPRVGLMRDPPTFPDFVHMAHQMGIKVIIDLVLNHCSVQHPWFLSRKENYFYWANQPKEGWHNLFDDGSAWEYDASSKKYYLHMFHKSQADLAWFDADGRLNETLVKEFRRIIGFWLSPVYGEVDGFRLDVPQSINKDVNADELRFGDMLYGDKAKQVINALFDGFNCLLVMECFDPTYGEILNSYIQDTPVQYGMNILVKGLEQDMGQMIHKSAQTPGFVLDLESHDSCRFLSRKDMTLEQELEFLFDSGAQNVCLYQGQEFGLKNPTLTREQVVALDAQAAMRMARGESFESLRDISRANARVPLPEGEYKRQDLSSELTPFKKFKEMISLWKMC